MSTASRILKALKDGPALNQEIAVELEISTNLAHMTLTRLVHRGLVQAGEPMRSGGMGRPSRLYSLVSV